MANKVNMKKLRKQRNKMEWSKKKNRRHNGVTPSNSKNTPTLGEGTGRASDSKYAKGAGTYVVECCAPKFRDLEPDEEKMESIPVRRLPFMF